MKVLLAFLVVLSTVLTGCAARTAQSGDSGRADIARVLDKRIIDCTLPFMNAQGVSHAEVRYSYLDGKVAFHTQPVELATHLGMCATPLTRARAGFKGRIQIWPENAS